jgi:MipA family protein
MALADWRPAAAAVLLFAPVAALAADLEPAQPPPPAAPATYTPAVSEWMVTIGAEVRAIPAYPGAPTNLYSFTGFPLFVIQKPGDPPFFFGGPDSFGVPIINLGPFQAGPVGRLGWPRYQSQYGQLNGLGDVNLAVQLGGFAQYWVAPWLRLRGELRQGFGGETGQTGSVFLDALAPIGQWRISGGPRVTLQSTAAVTPYFNVNAAQSAASGLPVYDTTGGFYSYGAGGQIEYFFNPQWSAHTIVEYERITGSAADSPLVTVRGSPNQFTVGVGATYTFGMHPLFGLPTQW